MASESLKDNRDAEQPGFLNKKTLIIGKRATGKTCLVDYIYHKIQDEIDEVYHIHLDSHLAQNYPKFYKPEEFEALFNKVSNNGKRKLFVFDNSFPDNNFHKTDAFKTLMISGKNLNCTVIISVPYPIGFPPMIRIQFDNIFCAKELNYSNQQRIYSYYLGFLPSLKVMQNHFDRLKAYEFAYANIANCNKIEVSKFKAQLVDRDRLRVDNFPSHNLDIPKKQDPLQSLKDSFVQLQNAVKKFSIELSSISL